MCDERGNGKHHHDDYTRIKKTIQEIVGMSKSKTPEKATKIRKKKEEPQDRSKNLIKQFMELKQFQKGLAAATLDGGNLKKLNESKDDETELSSDEFEHDKGSISSSSDSRTPINKNHYKERAKREEYNTDELSETSSSEDSGRIEEQVAEETISDESYSEETSTQQEEEPTGSPGLPESDHQQNESTSVGPVKKKSLLSASELAIIKDLCRDLIKKKEEPKQDLPQIVETPIKEKKVNECSEVKVNAKVCTEKTEESAKIEPEYEENDEFKAQPENNVNHKYETKPENTNSQNKGAEPENTNIQNSNTELENSNIQNYNKTENIIIHKYNPEPENLPLPSHGNVESTIQERPPPEEYMIDEITEGEEESNEGVANALLVRGELNMASEHKEETIMTEEKFERVEVEIVTKETVQKVDELKQRIEEKVVIEKTVKVNLEEAEVRENEIEEVQIGTMETALCNMSDDDLIRKTIMEMDQIDQEFRGKCSPEDENYYYRGIGDGDKMDEKTNLQFRIDRLQEQIDSLRRQLEEAKRQNEEEAREIGYLSAALGERGSSQLPSSLDWDEWELREMIRERMEQRRQAAMQDYQAKLRVVDALCSAEMGKLEEALQTLLPLNATASAWDPPVESADISSRSSWQTQDYVFEVTTSMNLSSSDENGVSGTISKNGEQPSSTEWKAEGQ